MTNGNVNITILDGGSAVAVPSNTVELIIGTSSAGTAAQLVATQNPNTVATSFGYGVLPQAAGLICLSGGTVICARAATVTGGIVNGKTGAAAGTITGATNATPIVITQVAHGYVTGAVVTIASVGGNTGANGTFKILKLTADTYSLVGSVGSGVYTSGGTATPEGVNEVATGTSVITVTGTPLDTNYIKFLCTTGGTIGAAGIAFQLSLDAGRNYGPVIQLGTATTYAIAGTGLTLAFAAGTLVAGDYATIGTTAPESDGSGIVACLTAFLNSPYALAGVGSVQILGAISGAQAATIETYLDTMAAQYSFDRVIMSARDASPPAIYGGTGESEATWMAAIEADFAATSAKRVCENGGYYNMPTAFPTATAGTPSYRRPLGWALACRQVQIPPQRHAGRVRDGALSNIIVNPTTDPYDGFVYHDERLNPGLDAARFCSARTRVGLPGYYIVNPNLMSPPGSVFTLLPLGNVMDIACTITNQVGQQSINDDIRLNANGTIYENEALAIEAAILGQITAQMIATAEISNATVTVDRTNNILATSTVNIAVVITARGYVLQENVTIGFLSPFAAGG